MENEKLLHNPMNTTTKRMIFLFLFVFFAVYTILVAGTVTDGDKSVGALTQDAKIGKLVFQRYNCIACHQVYGLGGYMGPDLTNVASANGKGPAFIKGLLKYGTNKMPDFNLNDEEIDQLTAYLNYIDKTGLSPVTNFTINSNGTYSCAHNEK